MSFSKEVVAGSQVLTQTMWNRQVDNIGSYLNYSIGVNVGSTVYIYSGGNVVSGLSRYENQTSDTNYIYSGGNVVSGITLINGQTVTAKYIYSGTNIIRVDKVIV